MLNKIIYTYLAFHLHKGIRNDYKNLQNAPLVNIKLIYRALLSIVDLCQLCLPLFQLEFQHFQKC